MTLLDSFITAYEDEANDGPDATRLPGLVALARLCLEEARPWTRLGQHLREMSVRVASARKSRQADFQAFRDRYDEELVSLVEENLEGYKRVEQALQAVLLAFQAGNDGLTSLAIEQLEEQAAALQATTEELTDLHTCGALVCPHCGMPGKDLQCATCAVDCFYPDAAGQPGPSGKFQLPESYWKVFNAYSQVLRGEGLLEELFDALDPLEKALLQAEDMVEQVTEERPEDLRASTIEDVLDDCLEGIAQMRAVAESRQLSDLNEGWSDLVTSSVELYRLLPNLALGTLA